LTLERNLTLYPWFQAAAGFLPWLPIFFLYFHQFVSTASALQLSAIYYFSVFLLEVPSGYFSDRYGRRLTLILASCFAVFAYIIFFTSTQFYWFAIAQFLLAGFFSFKSGSDNALLYDTLKALGRESEYATREANGTRAGMLALALSALIGGISGFVNLSIAYALSLCGALWAMYLAIQFKEPAQAVAVAPFVQQLRHCIAQLRNANLLWFFLFFVCGYSLQHILAEFAQPYISVLNFDPLLGSVLTSNNQLYAGSSLSAFTSGCMVTISMLFGAWGASMSVRMTNKLGVRKLLLCSLLIMLIIIFAMGSILHPAILGLVLLRNFPMALAEAPLLAAIAPHLKNAYRATYLSMQSLVARLCFAFVLFAVSGIFNTGDAGKTITWQYLQSALLVCLLASVICVAALALFKKSKQVS